MNSNKKKIEYLQEYFSDVVNYDADDPLSPIDPLSYRSPEGDTCLHMAAISGDDAAVRYLVELGLDIDSCGDMHDTPLHYAVRHRNASTVDLLISLGASVDKKNEFGKTPSQSDGAH